MTTLEKCPHCQDVILESEYDLNGPGHACKKMNLESLNGKIYKGCEDCVLFSEVEKFGFGYCKMLPPGKNEVSKAYKDCKYQKYLKGDKK
jgi:hypothetical protein